MKKISNKELAKMCSFHFSKNEDKIFINLVKNSKKEEMKGIFNKNIKKFTFLGIILPCIEFFFIFLITMLELVKCYTKGKIEEANYNIYIIVSFLCGLFLILAIFLLIKVIKKEKCYYTIENSTYCYKYIKYEEYLKICEILK